MRRKSNCGVPSRTGEHIMFDNLDEQIANELTNNTRAERAVRCVVVTLLSVLVFGALFWGVWLLEY
jgi:hypothetical protein